MSLTKKELAFLRAARTAHLATADKSGQPHVIPICFVCDGKEFFSPIDEKPKRVAANQLKRLRNIRSNPRVSLIIDRYDEDWRRLAWVLITGQARVLSRGRKHKKAILLLRKKYSQYQAMNLTEHPVIAIAPARIKSWGNL